MKSPSSPERPDHLKLVHSVPFSLEERARVIRRAVQMNALRPRPRPAAPSLPDFPKHPRDPEKQPHFTEWMDRAYKAVRGLQICCRKKKPFRFCAILKLLCEVMRQKQSMPPLAYPHQISIFSYLSAELKALPFYPYFSDTTPEMQAALQTTIEMLDREIEGIRYYLGTQDGH